MRKYLLLVALVLACSFTGCKKQEVTEGMEPDGIIQETDVITDAPEELLVETEILEENETIIMDEEMITGEDNGVVVAEEE